MEEGMSGFYIQPIRAVERKGTSTTATGTKCGRWNPTAEQVKVLTDLFRAGLRTPSTEQIQKISSQLSFYGKIESKNVFYWFQNHKARERQKRRRVSKDKDSPSCFQLQHLNMPTPTPSKWERHGNEAVGGGGEKEREIETLELFPMKKESERLSLWMLSRDRKENNNSCTNNLAREIDYHHHHLHHPPLDLRLSFF